MSDELNLDSGVVDWVLDSPDSVEVFKAFGIDYTCGGQSLRYACERAEVDPLAVMRRLEESRSELDPS